MPVRFELRNVKSRRVSAIGFLALLGPAFLAGCAAPGSKPTCDGLGAAAEPSQRMDPGNARGLLCPVDGRETGTTGAAPLRISANLAQEATGMRPEAYAVASSGKPGILSSDPGIVGSIPDAASGARSAVASATGAPGRVMSTLSIPEAVALALSTHPRIGAQYAAIRGAKADADKAGSALYPSLAISAGAGPNELRNWTGQPHLFDHGDREGALRSDIGFTFRQLVYDFGAARSEMQRTQSMALSEKLKLADEAEKIGLQTANAYLKIIEQRQVMDLIDQTLKDYEGLSSLVQASHQDGNGTLADVQRIKSRMVEIRAMRTDIDTERVAAENEFRRLTAVDVKTLKPPRDISSAVPASLDLALRDALASNPGLLALGEATRAYTAQRQGVSAAQLPRIDLQGDGLLKSYSSGRSRSDLDARAMVMVSYKLFDGGLGKAQTDRADADLERSRYQLQDEREQVELQLRGAYQTRAAAVAKMASIGSGVEAAGSVKELYLEQFRAGKKSIFEVIDGYMSYFTMRRQQVNTQYDKLRAAYQILRLTGRLNDAFARQI